MQLGRIFIYPIKSLDGISVESARITPGGILENDRVYAIYDAEGKVVNGKRTARIHALRCAFDAGVKEVQLWENAGAPSERFVLADSGPIGKWLSDFFGFQVSLRFEGEKGFPDDLTAFGPTIISEESLTTIRGWFPELTLESVRRRFRANLELLDAEPFGEDRLFGASDELKSFHMGAIHFFGHNPCQRCAVPTREPDTGQSLTDFQKKFMQMRRETLPPWSNAQRFNHYYRFAINTSIPPSETGKELRVGDVLTL